MAEYSYQVQQYDLLDELNAQQRFFVAATFLRTVGIVLSIFMVVGSVIPPYSLQSAVPFFVGLILLGALVIRPLWLRFLALKAWEQSFIQLVEHENGLTRICNGVEEFYPWPTLDRCIGSPKGIFLVFLGKRWIWIPDRVFKNKETRANFIARIKTVTKKLDELFDEMAKEPIGIRMLSYVAYALNRIFRW